MKQITHTWIALRALDLIRRDRKTVGLAKVLTPWAKHSYIGCWLPDMANFRKGHGMVNNHTFKMGPFTGDHLTRFTVNKQTLLCKLDDKLAIHGFLKNDQVLSGAWWEGSYKAKQPVGKHLPDCLASLFDTIVDLLLMGNKEVDDIVPGNIGHSKYLDDKVTLTKDQVSTFFFMISHYIADCFMPCHCDVRPLAAYDGKMHEPWELHWDEGVSDYFKKENLLSESQSSEEIINHTTAIDEKFGLSFPDEISVSDSDDLWELAIMWCRASFALSAIVFPSEEFPFEQPSNTLFGAYFNGKKDQLRLYDMVVLQSAVYAVASTWKKIWRKFDQA